MPANLRSRDKYGQPLNWVTGLDNEMAWRMTNSEKISHSAVESDRRSLYFLSNADHPGVLLVSEKLSNNNYHSWSQSMFLSSKACNKLGFIDGSFPIPAETDSLFAPWSKCDIIVLSWLLNSLSPKIAQSVIYVDSSYAMWLELEERFSQGNGLRIFELQNAISTLCQEQHDISTYFIELKVLWDESYVMKFLMGLTDNFDNVRGQILMMDPLPSINKVFSLVIQEERQKLISSRCTSSAFVESVALATKGDTSFKTFKGNPRNKLLCSHCSLIGHTVDKCYKLHGYPPNYKFRDKSKVPASANANQHSAMLPDPSSNMSLTMDQYRQLLALLKSISSAATKPSVNMALVPNFSGNSTSFCAANTLVPICSRIIDSGASDYMVCSSIFYTSPPHLISSSVKLPNGSYAEVTHVGDIVLSLTLTLTNVLCVSTFSFNLISVSKLTSILNCCLIVKANKCFLQDLVTWKMIGMGELQDGLYKLVTSSSVFPIVSHSFNCLSV
ncbi:uncharacterized protein LOC122278348 [Carya illinoinensis]|uniref:uncharacterized protein LOC122278348 n=1 Tax=Carya illinoinensis TaxID=32201 RepID=UPI001C724FB3|nr:uncharacterized protein LOC122278348 [Carya illinoinensis]